MRPFSHSGSGKSGLPGCFFAKPALRFAARFLAAPALVFVAAVLIFAALALLFSMGAPPVGGPQAQPRVAPAKICRYSTWEWNTRTRTSVNHRWVNQTFEEVTPEERDPASRCSVCEADQITVRIEGLPEFRICKYFAEKVEAALLEIRDSGFPIRTVVGYRVGRTRGKPDANGLRTRFSNHSFGTALDLNAGLNGMYSNCVVFGEACRLIRGGHWRPPTPGALTVDSLAVAALKAMGWKWGGEIAGRQKDFMHFSLTGY